jgi:hypothetical protein
MTVSTTSTEMPNPDIIEAEILSEHTAAEEKEVVYLSPQPVPSSASPAELIANGDLWLAWATSPWTIAGATCLLIGNILLGWGLRENPKPSPALHSTMPELGMGTLAPPHLDRSRDPKSQFMSRSLSTLQPNALNRPTGANSYSVPIAQPPSLAATLLPPLIGTPAAAPTAIAQPVAFPSQPSSPVPRNRQTVPRVPPSPAIPFEQAASSVPASTPPTNEQRLQQILRTQSRLEQDNASQSFYQKTQKQLQDTVRQNPSGEGQTQDSAVERLRQQIQRNQGN